MTRIRVDILERILVSIIRYFILLSVYCWAEVVTRFLNDHLFRVFTIIFYRQRDKFGITN